MERKRSNRLIVDSFDPPEKKETRNLKSRPKRGTSRRGGRQTNKSSGDDASSNSNGSNDALPARRGGSVDKVDRQLASSVPRPAVRQHSVGIRSQDKIHSTNNNNGGSAKISGAAAAVTTSDHNEPADVAGLESASFLSRLAYDKLTPLEIEYFPDLQSPPPVLKAYLYIRNKILLHWIENATHQLLLENVLPQIESPFSQDINLIKRIFCFLERQSLINFGICRVSRPLKPSKTGRSVIVLGAGVAGLGAARQLAYFGLDVTVVEARGRVGGRIDTFRSGEYIADLGAMVIMGLGGNPINILSRQIYMDLTKVRPKCPLFDHAGNVVPRHKDELIEREWNKLLEATVFLSHHCGFNYFDGKPLSLGEMMQLIIALQEKHVMDVQAVHLQQTSRLYDQLDALLHKMVILRENIKKTSSDFQDLKIRCAAEKASPSFQSSSFTRDDFLLRVKRIELQTGMQEYEQLESQVAEMERRIKELEDRPPPDQYLSSKDRHVLEWHMANLEFANAVTLDQLSLAHWSQDDEYELKGAHLIVRNGYSVLPTALAEGLDVRLNHRVCEIAYNDKDVNGVRVVCSTEDGELKTLTADVCLCTIPLGILKESIAQSHSSGTKDEASTSTSTFDTNGPPLFNPPLPKWKTDAAERLGYGNLNKIILCYETAFWDTSLNIFGHVAGSSAPRGECFLFWTCWSAPVLLALVSGEAADEIEKVSDDEAIERCTTILKGIFGPNIPAPQHSIVTRWRQDPFARGSYSHIAVGATGDDYDIMAAPVTSEDDECRPRLFFAGEHTMRQYPASVHGALLSGFREAGRIADLLLDQEDK